MAEVQRLLARDAEDVTHALRFQALAEDVGGAAAGHPMTAGTVG
jgi:hypothetical protein